MLLSQNSRRTTVSHINSEEEAELSGERAAPPKGDDGSEVYEDNPQELEDMPGGAAEQEEAMQWPGAGPGSGRSWQQGAGQEQAAVTR